MHSFPSLNLIDSPTSYLLAVFAASWATGHVVVVYMAWVLMERNVRNYGSVVDATSTDDNSRPANQVPDFKDACAIDWHVVKGGEALALTLTLTLPLNLTLTLTLTP